jgi:hypothetical protein
MYYIYHIPGIKIGCTNNIKLRMQEQKFTNWEILAEYEDIYKASDKEIQLQKQYGYRVDTIPYHISYNRFVKGSKIACKNGLTELQKQSIIKNGNITKERYGKKVIATNLITNEELIFNSQKETARELNITLRLITRVLKGLRKTTNGFTFRYVNPQ